MKMVKRMTGLLVVALVAPSGGCDDLARATMVAPGEGIASAAGAGTAHGALHAAAPPAPGYAPGHGPAAHAAPLPIRKSWPKLRAWMAGEEIDTEPTASMANEASLASHGELLFGTYCRNCHGDTGHGDGPRSPVFEPRPRDLAHGVYKFRTTPSGALPTREDLFRIISAGIRGTGMLPFADLPELERWAIVAYVRTLSPRFVEEEPEESLDVPPVPSDLESRARVRRGKKVYAEMKCGDCHGETGRGDGPSAPTLMDEAGRPLPPADFASKPLKRGDDPAQTWLSIMTGLDGTPMPSYSDALAEDRRWDLVAYTHSLRSADLGIDERDRAEAKALVDEQYAAAVHTVVGGCGCSAGKKR